MCDPHSLWVGILRHRPSQEVVLNYAKFMEPPLLRVGALIIHVLDFLCLPLSMINYHFLSNPVIT